MALNNKPKRNLETDTHIFFLTNWMSNFQDIPNKIEYNGYLFNNTEQLFMYLKAEFFKDKESMDLILKTPIPQEVKLLGRGVKNFINDKWDKVRYDMMLLANRLKYSHAEFKEKLLKTGNKELIEANEADKIWGCGLYADNPLILNNLNWTGQNLLGKVLMQIREELSNE